MPNINEFNLPLVCPPPVSTPIGMDMIQTSVQDPVSQPPVFVEPPAPSYSPNDITVYASSITPVDSMGGVATSAMKDAPEKVVQDIAQFDIVFNVGVNCGGGVSKTYQVVKRIGVDKCRLACDAESTTPVSIVESQDVDSKRRWRKLAGME